MLCARGSVKVDVLPIDAKASKNASFLQFRLKFVKWPEDDRGARRFADSKYRCRLLTNEHMRRSNLHIRRGFPRPEPATSQFVRLQVRYCELNTRVSVFSGNVNRSTSHLHTAFLRKQQNAGMTLSQFVLTPAAGPIEATSDHCGRPFPARLDHGKARSPQTIRAWTAVRAAGGHEVPCGTGHSYCR